MTDLFITRHGETVWNTEKRFQGFNNSDLTDKGVKLAKNLNKVIRENNIELVISSSLGRAKETAKYAIGDLDIPLIIMDEFKEINLGDWEGRKLVDLEKEEGKNFYNFWHNPDEYKPQGGESYEDVINRVTLGFINIIKDYEGKRILLVTHGMTLMCILSVLLRKELKEFLEEPVRKQTSITHIKIDVLKNKLILDNDTSHIIEGE